MDELVEKLYQEIKKDNSKNTLLNNIDLFKEFYESRSILFKCFNNKMKKIIKYILKYEEGEIFKYFYSDMLETLNRFFGMVHVNAMYKDGNVKCFYNVLNSINFYNDLKNIISYNRYAHKSNSLNCSSVSKFNDETVIRNLIVSLITQVSYNFFKIPNEDIMYSIDIIQNNSYIDKLLNKNNYSLMDKEFINKYIDEYVNVVEFCTNNDMKDDKLLNFILKKGNNNIKDKKIISSSVTMINKKMLLSLYNVNASNFLNQLFYNLESLNFSNEEFNFIVNENIDEILDYFSVELLELIVDGKYSYYDEKMLNKILGACCFNIKELYDNKKVMHYILSNEFLEKYKEKLINAKLLYFNLSLKNNEECKYSILPKQSIKIIDENEQDRLLSLHMSGKKKIKIDEMLSIIVSIIKRESLDDNISLNLFTFKNILGSYNNADKKILLDFYQIYSFIENPGDIGVFDTLFHELRHENQYYNMNNNFSYKFEKMKKEKIVIDESIKFYDENYKNISYEQDAREAGFYKLILFLRRYVTDEEINEMLFKLRNESKEFEKNDERIILNTEKVTIDEIYEKLLFFKPQLAFNYKGVKHCK